MDSILDEDTFRSRSLVGARKSKRLLNYIIDFIPRSFLFVCYLIAYDNYFPLNRIAPDFFLDHFLALIVWFSIYFLTYFISEYILNGKTIGKFITRTSVVTKDGGKPKLKRYLNRSLLRLIPFEGVLFLANKKCLHDYRSGTLVVDDDSCKAFLASTTSH